MTRETTTATNPGAARHPLIRRDTAAWRMQVWISFFIAALLCASGLMVLPGAELDRAFMVMGYVFCISSAFGVSKFVRDNESQSLDSNLWKLVVWGGFFIAMALTAWGLIRMTIDPVWKAYLVVSWLFLISTVFTLAKTLRDAHDADLLTARLEARLEGLASTAFDTGNVPQQRIDTAPAELNPARNRSAETTRPDRATALHGAGAMTG